MFEPVQAEEMAFAMTLFVSAANGLISMGSKPLTRQNKHQGQMLFLSISSEDAEVKSPTDIEEALQTPLYHAFLVVWEHYRKDPFQASIAARVLGFYYMMARSKGAALDPWLRSSPDSEESVILHPAVVQSICSMDLQPDGRLDVPAFLRIVQSTAKEYPGELNEALCTTERRAWPVCDGALASMVREHNWSKTTLGPAEHWPQSLKAVVDLVLACRFPMVMLWGEDFLQIYNDCYRDLMGERHPAGLGQNTRDCWPEVWHINEPIYARVRLGETLTFEDGLYPIKRLGKLEDVFFTLCYSPLRNEAGDVAGILVTVFETTERVKAEATQDRVRGWKLQGPPIAATECF